MELLLHKMQRGGDFPALSEAVVTINQIASSDRESVNKLSNSILKDFALTNKLLKLANTAYYSHAGGGSISTVSRAVVMLGFDAVRSIALSLMLFDNLENRAHARQMKEEFVKALFAGMLARDMAVRAGVKDAEEAFICAMFHNLGRTLAMSYLPDETQRIRELMQAGGCSEAKAAVRVLGVSFEELGIGVARAWGFPDAIVLSMKKLPDDKVSKGTGNSDKLRVLAGFSNELCEIIIATPEAERARALTRLNARFGDSLPMSERQLAAQMDKSLRDVAQFAGVMKLNLKQSAFAQQASAWAGAPDAARDTPAASDGDSVLAANVLRDTAPGAGRARAADVVNAAHAVDAGPRSTEEIQSLLTAGLNDISNAMVDDTVSPDDLLRMILEVIYTGMGFSRALLCLRDDGRDMMRGRFGFGCDAQDLSRVFQFAMSDQPDVFHVALANNADILITDIDDPKIATRIPAWYRRHIKAGAFVVLPMQVKGKPVGMIYADRPQAGDIAIPEKELSLLKALRNQAVLAIRQRV
jgi:HD-like signal output (HDOD) protein